MLKTYDSFFYLMALGFWRKQKQNKKTIFGTTWSVELKLSTLKNREIEDGLLFFKKIKYREICPL